MNTFQFYPVGQGLFYAGSLADKTYNFIYDCGTSSREEYLDKSIESLCKTLDPKNGSPTVEFVVISHLHADHFNGLWKLANKAFIKRVYLPYIGDKELTLFVLSQIFFSEQVENENAYRQFLFACRLYGIEREGNEFDFLDFDVTFLGNESVQEVVLHDGEYQYSYSQEFASINDNAYWKFVFFNRSVSDEKRTLLWQKTKRLLAKEGIVDITEAVQSRDFLPKLRKAYDEVFARRINDTCTLLLHYPYASSLRAFCRNDEALRKTADRMLLDPYCNRPCPCNSNPPAVYGFCSEVTLLTGDATLEPYLIRLISEELPFPQAAVPVGVLQIPHHGSKQSWLPLQKLQERLYADVYVLPFGLGNPYGHPHESVVDELKNTAKLRLVHQLDGFEYVIV